jgi:hypothetical protein
MSEEDRRYFIVKHDRESFLAIKHHVWRTEMGSHEVPPRFDRIRVGDRWVSFAFIDNEQDRRPLSQIVGFSECVRPRKHEPIPPEILPVCDGETEAWFIKGQPFGNQPASPVDVLPLREILGRNLFNGQTITPISAEDFELLRQAVFNRG